MRGVTDMSCHFKGNAIAAERTKIQQCCPLRNGSAQEFRTGVKYQDRVQRNLAKDECKTSDEHSDGRNQETRLRGDQKEAAEAENNARRERDPYGSSVRIPAGKRSANRLRHYVAVQDQCDPGIRQTP